jgi:hypothetical protein
LTTKFSPLLFTYTKTALSQGSGLTSINQRADNVSSYL